MLTLQLCKMTGGGGGGGGGVITGSHSMGLSLALTLLPVLKAG